jgi:hypothetical protein
MKHRELPDMSVEARPLEELAPKVLMPAVALFVIGTAGALGLGLTAGDGGHHLLETYLVSFSYFLSLSLGGLFFVLLQHLTRAGWSVTVRRVAESLGANVILMAVLAVPVVLGMEHIYHWAHAGAADHDPILAGKIGFLNPSFFIIRLVIYFVVWIALAWYFYRSSVAQDVDCDPNRTRRMAAWSAPGMILFALSINFAAFDLLMSTDPHWFSTIYGVYYFAGSVVVTMATMPVLFAWLQRRGRLRGVVTVEHYHDMGKLLFGFVVFWAYIGFSQYMLYWYGSIPEETQWYLKRQTGDWTWLSLGILFGHFIIPFLMLISRYPKRRPRLLVIPCLWLIVMHWFDLYWLVGPEFNKEGMNLGLVDLFTFLGMGGLFFIFVGLRLRKRAVAPIGDPRLAESLAFENA